MSTLSRLPQWVRIIAPFAAPLAVVALEIPLLFPRPAVGDDFLFWALGHIIAAGGSPYDSDAFGSVAAYGPVPGGVAVNTAELIVRITHQHQPWLYPPQTAFVFVPFGMLPFAIGVPLFEAFIFLASFVAVSLIAWRSGLRGVALAFALTLAVVSQPFVSAVRVGHPIGLLIIGGALLLGARRDRGAAAGTALLTLKPHIVIPIAAFAAGQAIARRDARRLAVMLGAAIAVTLPFELITPFQIDSLTGVQERLDFDLTTIPALARDLGGGAPLAWSLTALLVVACGLAVALASPIARPRVVAACLFVLSVGLVPYAHDYDLFMALPAVFVALSLGMGHPQQLATSLIAMVATVVPWVLFFWWPLAGEPDRYYQGGMLGAVPIVFAFALAACAFLTRETRSRVRPQREPLAPAG